MTIDGTRHLLPNERTEPFSPISPGARLIASLIGATIIAKAEGVSHERIAEILRDLAKDVEDVEGDPRFWLSMDAAPRDGTPIQARVPGHGSDFIIGWITNLVGEDGMSSCGAWCVLGEQEPPDDWCDGICWAKNSVGKPSTQPDGWMPIRSAT